MSTTWRLVSELSDVDMIRLAAKRVDVRLTHAPNSTYRLIRWGGVRPNTARLETGHGSLFTKSKNQIRMVAVPDDFTREEPP